MSTEQKLEFLLRAIVTAGGPEQAEGMSDEVFILTVTNWLLRPNVNVEYATSTSKEGGCGCRKP